jgi:hypothetical protein
MRRIVNPQQTRLFDSFNPVLSERARQRLLDDWPGVFRHVILELMPVGTLAGHFSVGMGRPTKELYSMAGLILLMEQLDWTKDQAVCAYCFHMEVHYALNLEPVAHDLSVRTLERYIDLFEQDDLAARVMHDVSITLVELLDIRIDQQRLDSTHVFSNMAQLGRTRLMGAAIKQFLTQLRRHDKAAYESLAESLRKRYAPSVHHLFGDTGKDSESRRLLRQQVAEDMHALIERFSQDASHAGRETYKTLERIFYEQCEVQEAKVVIKAKPGGQVMQNPSDPDATRDGHKGPGYQVQISETCNPQNEVQLVTSALPQTASVSDSGSVAGVLEDLAGSQLLPEQMAADTSYCSDENVQKASEAYGVELLGPVPSGSLKDKDIHQLNIDDFNIDENTEEVICCPAGHSPVSSEPNQDTGQSKTVMSASVCERCPFVEECPVSKTREGYVLRHSGQERRIAGRRREQDTEVFRERYRVRNGIEGTNSGMKRRTGLGRVRVRGRPRVFQSILLKVTGWNILRASVCAKMREIVYRRASLGILGYLWPMPVGIFSPGRPRKDRRDLPEFILAWSDRFRRMAMAA